MLSLITDVTWNMFSLDPKVMLLCHLNSKTDGSDIVLVLNILTVARPEIVMAENTMK